MHNGEIIPQSTVRNVLTRDFILGFLALFTFMAGTHCLTPTLPIYLSSLGSLEGEIGALIGVVGIASLVSRLFVGGALLRYPEKRVMAVGALLSVLVFFSYMVFRPFWPFFIMRFFQGVAFACLDTAVLAVVVNATPQRHRGQAIGYLLLASPLSMAIASSAGVHLSNRYGFPTLFLCGAGLSLCALASSTMVEGRKAAGPEQETSAPGSHLLDLNILVPAVVSFLTAFALSGLFAFIPLHAVRCGVRNPGVFFSAVAIMLFAARVVGGKVLVAYEKEKVIPVSILPLMLAAAILAFSSTVSMFVLVGLLWGTGLAFVNPAAMAYSLEYAGSSGGTALGTHQMFMDLGLALGPVVTGIIVSFTGYRVAFLCLAFVCLLNAAYFQFYVRRRRNMRAMTKGRPAAGHTHKVKEGER
jgi:MFS family permease